MRCDGSVIRAGESGDAADRVRRGRVRSPALALALAALCLAFGAQATLAQEDEEPRRLPSVTAGTPVVVLPLQSARPTAGGAWLAGARSQQDAIDALAAELAFAFGEQHGAEAFVLPDEVEARARRNPLAKVDPGRLAYRGLLREPEPRAQIYEPLHSQLRRLAALFDSRIVVLPLALWFEPGQSLPGRAEPEASEAEPEAEDESRGAEPASPEREGTVAEPKGRAVLLFAVIDVRRSAVLWHGEFRGTAAELDSPTLLTSLAFRVARQLSP